jgi:hypothetical protein
MSETLTVLLWHLVLIFFLGTGIGYFIGMSYARAKTSLELIDTYKHLLAYGQPEKPVATVREGAPPVEERIRAEVSDTAIANLAEHLAKEANVSGEAARAEAIKLVAGFETYGVPPE